MHTVHLEDAEDLAFFVLLSSLNLGFNVSKASKDPLIKLNLMHYQFLEPNHRQLALSESNAAP